MFSQPLILSLSLLSAGTLGLGVSLSMADADIENDYARHVTCLSVEPAPPAVQDRQWVRKEILHAKEPDLCYHLDCDHSTLAYKSNKELVEQMDGVQGRLQEELFYVSEDGREFVVGKDGAYHQRDGSLVEWLEPDPTWQPMQTIRSFKANSARFSYNQQTLTTNSVVMTRYRAPGHKLDPHPSSQEITLRGSAESVDLNLAKGEKLRCHAKRFRATLPSLR